MMRGSYLLLAIKCYELCVDTSAASFEQLHLSFAGEASSMSLDFVSDAENATISVLDNLWNFVDKIRKLVFFIVVPNKKRKLDQELNV